MTFYRTALRSALRPVTRSSLPGRNLLVELLKSFIIQDQPLVAKTADSLLFELDLHDLIQRQIYFDLYDRSEVKSLCRLIQPGDVVFDVGSNVGFYAVNFARAVGESGRVHVFEPVPQNIAALNRNLELNSLQGTVIVNPVAVAAREQDIQLYLPTNTANSGWASIVATASRPNILNVRAVPLDAYMEKSGIERVALIKMDIEGAELQAFQGMFGTLARDDAPMIYFEINPFLLKKQQIEPVIVKQFLCSFGYTLFTLHNSQFVPVSPNAPEYNLRNILATKRPAVVK